MARKQRLLTNVYFIKSFAPINFHSNAAKQKSRNTFLHELQMNKSGESVCGYQVKNYCCFFERLFKVKKNGVFLLGIAVLLLEIFTFLLCK